MIWLKSILGGIVGILAAVVLAAVATLAWFAVAVQTSQGSGGIGVVIMSINLMLYAGIGFIAGFWWTFRRQRHQRQP